MDEDDANASHAFPDKVSRPLDRTHHPAPPSPVRPRTLPRFSDKFRGQVQSSRAVDSSDEDGGEGERGGGAMETGADDGPASPGGHGSDGHSSDSDGLSSAISAASTRSPVRSSPAPSPDRAQKRGEVEFASSPAAAKALGGAHDPCSVDEQPRAWRQRCRSNCVWSVRTSRRR
jgi:hypothetical protein